MDDSIEVRECKLCGIEKGRYGIEGREGGRCGRFMYGKRSLGWLVSQRCEEGGCRGIIGKER